MNTEPFYLSTAALERYRRLVYREDAEPVWNVVPFSTLLWNDEHPTTGRRFPHLPGFGDKESRLSIINLVHARTELWLTGDVPEELHAFWNEAKKALPDWPGFKRILLPEDEVVAVKKFRGSIDESEQDWIL